MKTVTGLSDRDAVEFLSKCGWMVDRAADLYLEAARKGYVQYPTLFDVDLPSAIPSSTSSCPIRSASKSLQAAIDATFAKYQG